MVLAPPAPHAPFTPAVRHNDIYKGTKAKRTPNFNTMAQMVAYTLFYRLSYYYTMLLNCIKK